MRPLVALLPSALLGPAVWSPVAESLRDSGWPVLSPPPMGSASSTVDGVLTWYEDAIPVARPVVVIPHSNAGLYVPALTARCQVAAMVYVDAGLPPRHGTFRVAPSGLYSFLETLADTDGLLPGWTDWWGDEAAQLFPHDEARRAVEAEQVRLPLHYFAGSLEATRAWDQRPAGYLAFGDTYADDRDEAAARGWPTRTLPGGHLHMLVDPEGVAAELDRLVTELLGPVP